jgi:hypothetical protein
MALQGKDPDNDREAHLGSSIGMMVPNGRASAKRI